MKLHVKLFLAFLVVILVLLTVLFGIQFRYQKELLRAETVKRLFVALELLAKDPVWLLESTPEREQAARHADEQTGMRITLILDDGIVAADSRAYVPGMDNHGDRPEVLDAKTRGKGLSYRFSDTVKKIMIYAAIPLDGKDDESAVVLRAAIPETTLREVMAPAQSRIRVILIILLLSAAAASYMIGKRVQKPIVNLAEAAEKLSTDSNNPTLPQQRQPEYDSLASSLNRLARDVSSKSDTIHKLIDDQKAILDNMQEGVIVIDNNRVITQINPAAKHLFNVPGDSALGRNILAVIRHVRMEDLITRATSTNTPVEEDLVIIEARERFLLIRGSRLAGPDGNPYGLLLVFSDVTRLRKLETMRREFVSSASHELKTPVTIIKGFAETLEAGDVPKTDSERYVSAIHRQAKRLESLINDLLNLARLEYDTERGRQYFETVRVADVVDAAVQAASQDAADRKIAITVTCDSALVASLDPSMMEHALFNLIQNALKYSPEGTGIEVDVTAHDDRLTFQVTDHGIGIAREHQERIFERFYRVDKSRSRQLGGTGLGLSIVKHVALLHKGTVSVTSEEGKGSSFIIDLPMSS